MCYKVTYHQIRDVSPAPTQCLIRSENEEVIMQPNSMDPMQTKPVVLEIWGPNATLVLSYPPS